MDELFFNKIAGAVLATALGYMAINEVAHIATHPHELEAEQYTYNPYGEAIFSAEGGDAEPEIVDPWEFQRALAVADASKGENVFKKCQSCHTIEQGGETLTGPNLWGIVGLEAAHVDSYPYSEAMATSGLTWDFETLSEYLEKPSAKVPGTAMTFAGLSKIDQRADIIAYLNSMSSNPQPLPVLEELPPIPTAEDNAEETVDASGLEDGTDATVVDPGTAGEMVEDGLDTNAPDAVDVVTDPATDLMDQAEEAIEDAEGMAEEMGSDE